MGIDPYMLHEHLNGSLGTNWRRQVPGRVFRGGNSRAATPLLLESFSTRVPTEVLDRSRVAAPQLGPHHREIAAVALDRVPSELEY